ncbi:hypothetical protein M514_12382 [Trichuris suis]|uniref:Uncharacterized protein n=1 Tax=Trichuris suis TaxID=68888 RepID=A0A085LP59_9BILA|nr:hypothetical protein M513_12382 [Trichuris suis]KFD60663.1 hypothetical protein M514_12382 [Trichuris suis]
MNQRSPYASETMVAASSSKFVVELWADYSGTIGSPHSPPLDIQCLHQFAATTRNYVPTPSCAPLLGRRDGALPRCSFVVVPG